jgi:hypothetical protein
MRTFIFSTLLGLLFSQPVQSQNDLSKERAFLSKDALTMNNSNSYHVEFIDKQGIVFKTENINEADGNPYFIDEWQKATITTENGNELEVNNTKIHLQSNKIYYKNDENKIIIVATGIIKKVILENNTDYIVFESGFPNIYKNNSNTFYKILSRGKYSLLQHIDKVFVQTKNDMTGEKSNEFKTYNSYYTFINGIITHFNLKKSSKDITSIVDVVDVPKFNIFLSKNKLKSMDDVTLLFDYLNK